MKEPSSSSSSELPKTRRRRVRPKKVSTSILANDNKNNYWNYDDPSLYLSIEEQNELDLLSTLIELSGEETKYLLSVWRRTFSTADQAGRKELMS